MAIEDFDLELEDMLEEASGLGCSHYDDLPDENQEAIAAAFLMSSYGGDVFSDVSCDIGLNNLVANILNQEERAVEGLCNSLTFIATKDAREYVSKRLLALYDDKRRERKLNACIDSDSN